VDPIGQVDSLIGWPSFSKYVFLRPLDIFFDLFDKERGRFEPDFISDSSFEIDLYFLAIDIPVKIQDIDF
jgi:hypothetical protein